MIASFFSSSKVDKTRTWLLELCGEKVTCSFKVRYSLEGGEPFHNSSKKIIENGHPELVSHKYLTERSGTKNL